MFENSPGWIPAGWTVEVKQAKSGRKVKCYLDPSTGYRFYSKPDVCYLDPSTGYRFYSKPDVVRYLKTITQNSFTSTQKKVGPGMPSLSKVVIERSTDKGLPEGWMKEIKIRMNGNGIRRDPYYMDPVSGYVFRSRKDVFRYLETGEISRHAFKPKNKCRNVPELTNDEISQPPEVKRRKLMYQKARECLFSASADTGISDISNLPFPETQGSRQTKQLFSETKFASEPPAETLQKMTPGEKEKYVESKKCSGLRSSDLQKNKGYKRKLKTKDKTLPCRSSKRLAGLKPHLVDNSGSSEQALAVAGKMMSGKSEVIPAPGVIMSSLDNTTSCQLEVILQVEPRHHASRAIEAPSDLKQSEKDHRYLEDEAIQEKEAGKLGTVEKTSDVPELPAIDFPFVDVWSDPCLEFAFKTLTGAIPIEDNMEIEGYFQQQIASAHAQNSSLTSPEFGLPSSQFDAQENYVPIQQFASKPTVLPQANVSLSGCSGISHPQCSFEGKKEYPTRVN